MKLSEQIEAVWADFLSPSDYELIREIFDPMEEQFGVEKTQAILLHLLKHVELLSGLEKELRNDVLQRMLAFCDDRKKLIRAMNAALGRPGFVAKGLDQLPKMMSWAKKPWEFQTTTIKETP